MYFIDLHLGFPQFNGSSEEHDANNLERERYIYIFEGSLEVNQTSDKMER